jgi:hypothetical protein
MNVTNSKGEILETNKKYPFNKTDFQASGSLTSAESSAIDNMISNNIISPILEDITKRAGTQINRKRLQYELVNGTTIAPVAVKYQNGSGPLETRTLFTKYDANGNLTEQQKSDDIKSSYIWDYQSTLPIAEVVNASQDAVAYTSFEADGTGSWLISSSSRILSDGITGKNSYQLSNGTISKSGLNTGITYTVSYWTKGGSALSITGTQGSALQGKTINGWTYFEHKIAGVSTVSLPSVSAQIDELRLYPSDAKMTTYTYDPLIGITSSTDLNNRINYYEYDSFQRLKLVRDQDGNIIKIFAYKYQEQQ